MKNQTSRARTDAHHKEVAETIIKLIEGGTAPWQKPWDGNMSAMMLLPFNGASKRRYRGINSLYLYSVASHQGYQDPRWFTFKQVEELGGKVKRGEKAVKVEYWQFKRTIKEDENGKPLPKEEWLEEDRKVPLIMRSAVFNAEQCEGLPELELPKRDWEPLDRADIIMKANGVPVFHDAVDRNYYSPSSDEIHLTPMEAFPTREAYYGTALHELGHSTGHEKRLNRQFGKVFGDENYAKEELRAEIASYMLCADLGISRQASDEQHAAYVGSWVKALKSDPNEIFRASADAESICNYLYDREREYMKTLGNEIEPNVPNNSVNYPEIEPSITKVAEQVAGYGVLKMNDNLREFESFYSMNIEGSDSQYGLFLVEDKLYLGKSDGLNIIIKDDGRYYDDSDGSLVHLSDNSKLLTLISDLSSSRNQELMRGIGTFTMADVNEAEGILKNIYEAHGLSVPGFKHVDTISVNAAAVSNFEKDGREYDVFIKDDAVYLGKRENYDNRGTYDNSDYSLMKVSDNRKMFHLLYGTGYDRSQEALIAQEDFTEKDFIEYAQLKSGMLSGFEQVRELEFDGVPFKSPLEVDEPIKGAAEMEKGKLDYLHAYHTNFAENGERKSTFIVDGKAYLGNYKNIKMEPGKDEVGNDVMVRYYDNTDVSLIHLSDKPEMASFIAERSFDIYQDSMADLGKFTLEDAREAERLESTVLSGYDEWSELLSRGMDDSLIVIDGAKPSSFTRDGKEQIAFVKNYEVYLGDASRYNGERVYDNSDYSLVKVSSNMQMYHLINGLSSGATREELISSGEFSRNDFFEYDQMRERILGQFDEVVPKVVEAEDAIGIEPVNVDVPEAEVSAAEPAEGEGKSNDNPYEGMTEVVEFVHTNFLKDGRRVNMVNLNGEVHLGYDDNCAYNIIMGDEPQSNRVVSYYDNRDNSLEYLGLNPNMAHFIAGMSYGWTQDEMLMVINSMGLEPAFTSPQYENWEFLKAIDFADFKHLAPVEAREDDRQIALHSAGSIKYVTPNGQPLAMFEKQGSYYIGKESNFNEETGRYDNNDYSLYKVTDRVNVKNLIVNEELDAKEALDKGSLTVADIDEYAVFRERTNQIFRSVGSNRVHNQRMMLASRDYEEKYPFLSGATIVPSNIKDLVLVSSADNAVAANDGTYLGKRQNLRYVYNPVHYGDKVYDNRDGSLVKLSDNPRIADLISERSFGYSKDVIMETYEGEFTAKDFEEYNKIYDEHLSKLEFTSTYDDMGRFDIKEAMKMADEQVNGQVNDEVKEFNPPSDAQLGLAASLHCKYKEDVSREELSKIIAKTMEARKKYYEAINQPAKETQIEVLKEAGVEIKEGLTIGQASKMIAELPASVDQKVFMDRLKIEYAPDITRGEVEKLIKGKMKELEARENEPASEKTREFMKSRGIEVPEKLTRREASKLIYNSAPTAKQMAFITNHKIECDKEKLTYGKASILVDKRLKYIDEQAKLPATEKQIKRLEKEKIEFAPDITRGEASKIINKLNMEKLQISDKQIKYANDLGLEIPENATKAEVTKMIGEKVRTNRIAEFEVPKDRKLTLSEGYYKLAQQYLEKGKAIDDKKIAASLLKDGHRDCDVKTVIHKSSPNCVNDLSKAQGIVNDAKKLPSVKKALEKENSR